MPRPTTARVPRGRIGLVLVAAILLVLLLSLRAIAGYYTDYLWFKEVHFTSIWRGVLGAKIALAVIFTVLFFVLLWVNLAIADRVAPTIRMSGPGEELFERYREVVAPRAALVRTGVSALFAIIAGRPM